jgi:hypothetical protein
MTVEQRAALPGHVAADLDEGRRRKVAEAIAEVDMRKDYRWLLSDVHEELLHPTRTYEQNQIHANKRLASLTAKSAHESLVAAEKGLRTAEESARAAKRGLWISMIALAVAIVALLWEMVAKS